LKRTAQTLVSLIDQSSIPALPIFCDKTRKSLFPFSLARNDHPTVTNSSNQKRVMICDDESDVLRAYRIALASKYSVLTATSGDDCLQKYEEELRSGSKVDVLLLDYKLGDMLGDEVACRIRDMDGTKIILISAYEISSSFLKELKQRNCITSFVKKPVTMSSLLTTIDGVLG
jgi:CheY-like chemotaxis protein